MRYSFLDLLACPVTHEPLVLVGAVEEPRAMPAPYLSPASRVSPPSAAVGPIPTTAGPRTQIFDVLNAHAAKPDAAVRNEAVIVREGLLVACNSGHWYPIVDGIPELLPDSLRDWSRDRAIFASTMQRLPQAVSDALPHSSAMPDVTPKPGDNYKQSELTLLDKVENSASFLGPGLLSPFNPYEYHHSSEYLRGFSICLTQMALAKGHYVLDSGSGYSWTTEWLMKMGIHAVGLEINRAYLDTGRRRMGPNQPHLVIADAENLPFQNGVFNSVLGFDAFHHIPNRKIAMRQFDRVMKNGSRVVLVEPGSAHTTHPVSIEVMKTYGTMEVGMELADVQEYIAGIEDFRPAVEKFISVIASDDERRDIPLADLKQRDFLGWCLYVIEKN